MRGFLSQIMVIMGHSRFAFPTGIEVDRGQESTLRVSAFDFTGTDFSCVLGNGSKIPARAEGALSLGVNDQKECKHGTEGKEEEPGHAIPGDCPVMPTH